MGNIIQSKIAFCALMAVLAVGGCGEPKPEGAEVPASVRALMDAQFPPDGQIHVHNRGQIVIKPETPVCEVWLAIPENEMDGYFGINSVDLFKPLGQTYSNKAGSDRQISAAAEVCRNPESVVIYGRKSNNRQGEPYKLVLAVWQGDPSKGGAVWVGGIERGDGVRPELKGARIPVVDPSMRQNPISNEMNREFETLLSVKQDVADLSVAFIGQLTNAGLR